MGTGYITTVCIYSIVCNMCKREEIFGTGKYDGRIAATRYVTHELGWSQRHKGIGFLCPRCVARWRAMKPNERTVWVKEHSRQND